MNYSEAIFDNDLKFEFLSQIQDGGQYQLSDFLPRLLKYLGYRWNRNNGRVIVAANLIEMHANGSIDIETFDHTDPQSIVLTSDVDFDFNITSQGLAILEQYQANASKTGRRKKKSTKAQPIAALVTQHKYPSPRSERTANEKIAQAIATRRGQQEFRQKLLDTYKRCLVTGCDAGDALEAAHIRSYNEGGTFELSNGLLLRADIHTLFDLGLIAVDAKDMTVIVSPGLENTYYSRFAGKPLQFPKGCIKRPDKAALNEHRKEVGV